MTKVALQMCFGRQILSDSRIYYWMEQFRSGRTRIVDLQRCPKPKSGRSVRNVRRVENIVAQDRRVTLARIMLQTRLKATTVHRILTKDLSLSKKCAKYVLYELGDQQVARRLTVCNFWTKLRMTQPRVFSVAVTMDESWIYCYDPETKEQSRQWLRSMEP